VNQKNTTLGGKRINEAQNQLRIGVHLYPFVLLTARLPHFFQSMNGSSDGCFATEDWDVEWLSEAAKRE